MDRKPTYEELEKELATLRKEKDDLENILNAMEVSVAVTDVEGNWLRCNPCFERFLGYAKDELTRLSNKDITHPEDFEKTMRPMKALLDGKIERYRIDKRYVRKDGTVVWADLSVNPVRDGKNEIVALLGAGYDITEKKTIQEKLRGEEKKYRRLFESLQEGIWRIDEQGRTELVNPAMAKMLGCTVDEMKGKHLFDFMDAKGVEIARANLEKRKKGVVEQHEFTFLHKNGRYVHTLLETFPVMGEDNRYRGAVASVMNISERKKMEKELHDRAVLLEKTNERLKEEIEERKKAEERNKEQSRLLDSILNSSLSAIMAFRSIRSENGDIVDFEWILVNGEAEKLQGMAAVNLLGRCLLEVYPENLTTGIFARYVEVVETGRPVFFEQYVLGPNLDDWYEIRAVKLGDGFVVSYSVVTERKNAEKKLRESRERFRILSENIEEVFWIRAPNGSEHAYNSPAFEKIWHREIDILTRDPKAYMDWVHPGDRSRVRSVFENYFLRGEPYECEFRIVRPDGAIRWINERAYPVKDKQGRVEFMAGIASDITDRKNAEAALRESEQRYRIVADFSYDWEYWIGADGRVLHMSPSCERITGYSRDEFLKAPDLIRKIVHPGDSEAWESHNRELMRAGGDGRFLDFRIVPREGGVRWISQNSRMVYSDDGAWLGRRVSNRDVTDRKKMEEAHKLNEERLDALLHLHSQEELDSDRLQRFAVEEAVRLTGSQWGCIHHFDEDGCVVSSNSWPEDMDRFCGSGQWFPEPIPSAEESALCCRPLLPTVQNDCGYALNAGEGSLEEFPVSRRMIAPAVENGRVVAAIVVANKNAPYDNADLRQLSLFTKSVWDILKKRSVSEEKEQLEKKLLQSRKMESIGTLAGGIAHDFNNILSSIVGFTELALDDLSKGASPENCLNEIYGASLRASELVSRILSFSKQTDENRSAVRVRDVAVETAGLLRAAMPASIEIRRNIQSDAAVLGTPTQIHQVFMNLFTNAAQAMEDDGGVLEIHLVDVDDENEKDRRLQNPKPGPYLKAIVSDTGKGMPPDIVDSIFDPYFTTKDSVHDTGMGLAVVHGIVESLGGEIFVESGVGKGTRFTIWFPVTAERDEVATPDSGEVVGGDERILFVDDDPTIVRMNRQVLERLGYNVTACTESPAALEKFREAPNDFDLVITDMTMPELTGDRLAAAMMEIRPDIPVILSTGYSKRIDAETAAAKGVKAFVQKPIIKSDMARTIRMVLDRGEERT